MKSIAKTGLKNYLNESADKHKGHGYDDFVTEVRDGQSVAALAVLFKVSRMTIYKWLTQYEAERGGEV